ncbi:MAG TPA: TetR/AcrR family transcriptional regulator [Solirubrobacteraceae bacterium]|nr:TetR/AcrR family transcriptional regulator [Solirubrobacteraceae bacterium]
MDDEGKLESGLPRTAPVGETGLPRSIESVWGVREPVRRGPRPGLTLESIIDAAITVAGRDGIAAVSMARVAAELGSSTMSLYRYVAAKDELLALMIDAASGPPPEQLSAADGWRGGLAGWAKAYMAVLRRHPWALRIPISGPPVTPNQLAWLEAGLAAMHGTGLEPGEKLSVMLLLSGYVRNDATIGADIQAASAKHAPPAGALMVSWRRVIERLADPGDFPELHAVARSGVLDQDDDPDEEFHFGLDRVLDGVDALVRARE